MCRLKHCLDLIVNSPAIKNKQTNKHTNSICFVIFGQELSVRFVERWVAWEIVEVCGGMWASETRRAEASPVIGANAAFNNRTKEELEMHMFKKCGFSPQTLSLSHSVALVILYWLWVWQKTKKSRKEAQGGGGAHRFCKVLLDVFIHFYVRIISSPASAWGGAKMTCSWLMESHLNFWSQCAFPRSSLYMIDSEIFQT